MSHSTLATRTWILLLSTFIALNGVAQGLSATLSAVDHNGYHITCFGAKDGQVTVTATGGTPPYNYSWSTGSTSSTVGDLAAGYLKVSVTDANANEVIKDITLTQPDEMKVELTAFKYPNDLNISCYECFNGSIDLEVFGGVAPYDFAWDDGPTVPDRSGLGALNYKVVITDANGCVTDAKEKLEQPEKATWGMDGNADTDPQQHYIGTSDAQDVVFKSNDTELLRLKGNGTIGLLGTATEEGPLFRREDGSLGLGDFPDAPTDRCFQLAGFRKFWLTTGNDFTYMCQDQIPKLGTLNAEPVRVITNGQTRIHISSTGKVGIGSEPGGAIEGYRLYVEDGIVTRDVLVKLGAWPDYVFEPEYELMPLDKLRSFLGVHHHLPGIPAANELEEQQGLALGDMLPRVMKVVEEQALYILQLEERLRTVELQLEANGLTKP
ncbi:MAG: SprB repeat-containing protein [Flavobacteriales bacterium]